SGSAAPSPAATPGAGGTPARSNGAPGSPAATPTAAGGRGAAAAGGGAAAAPAGAPCGDCYAPGATIPLGSIVTQTGPGRSVTMAHAIAAWEQDVNRRGGINGHR